MPESDAAAEGFDLLQFAAALKGLRPTEQSIAIQNEIKRAGEIAVRDTRKQFEQRLYLSKLEQLDGLILGVAEEPLPSVKAAYALLAGGASNS